MKRKTWKMSLLLILALFVVLATAQNITHLEVPLYGDPRLGAELVCHYVTQPGDPGLHSVKWYRDNNEIFRFTPGTQPPTRTFNTTTGSVTRGSCNMQSCTIAVNLTNRWNTRIAYTCEVSTEGPRFAVAKQTKYLSVAAILQEDPKITGIPGSVQPGEELLLNCSTSPAMPPANIVWYVDGRPEKTEPWVPLSSTEVSPPDLHGLRTSWRSLRLRVLPGKQAHAVTCEATQPAKPSYVRMTNATVLIARSPNLSMFTAYGSSTSVQSNVGLTVAVLVSVLHRNCALKEIGLAQTN